MPTAARTPPRPRPPRAERKLRLRQAAAEAAKEVEEYRTMRAHKLQQGTSEVRRRRVVSAGRLCALQRGRCRRCRRVRARALLGSPTLRRPAPRPPARLLQSLALVDKVRRVTAETDAKLSALDSEYSRNRDVVIGVLLQIVLSIENPYTVAKK